MNLQNKHKKQTFSELDWTIRVQKHEHLQNNTVFVLYIFVHTI